MKANARANAGSEAARRGDGPGVRPRTPQDDVLALQSQAGNRAVDALLAGRPAGSGTPLAPAVRARLERAFGSPLGHVRVHSGTDAAAAAERVGARAFTVDEHIALPPGASAGDSPEGYRVLAHEVTHVLQQRGRHSGSPRPTRRGEPVESEAVEVADRVAAGRTAGPISDSGGRVVARDESGPFAVTDWLGEKAKAAKEAAYGWLIRQVRDLHRSGIARLRGYGRQWDGAQRVVWDGIVDAVDLTMTILEGLVYAVVGIVAGFVTGILQMVVGLLRMVVGACEGILKLLYGFVDGGAAFDAWANDLAATIKAIPTGLKILVDDWLAEFRTASPEKSALMIGELTGQILAFLATLGVSAGKAGTLAQSAKLGPRLARLASSVPRIAVTTTGKTVLVAAGEASPQAVAATTKVVGTVAAATEKAGPTILAATAHGGGTGGGGKAGGGSGSAATQAPQKPAPQKPAPQKPAPQKPAPQKPAPQKGTAGKPAAGSAATQAPQKPAPQKPAPQKPAPQKGTAGKPAAGSSDYEAAEQAAVAAADQYRANLIKRFPKLADAELRSVGRPAGVPGIWEESVYTGSGRRSWTAKLREGKVVQIDDIDQAGTVVDTKMRDLGLGKEAPPAPHPDVVQQVASGPAPKGRTWAVFDEKAQNQLLRQLRFAKENGLPGVRWETNSAELAEEIRRYAKNILSSEEQRMLTVTPVER